MQLQIRVVMVRDRKAAEPLRELRVRAGQRRRRSKARSGWRHWLGRHWGPTLRQPALALALALLRRSALLLWRREAYVVVLEREQ